MIIDLNKAGKVAETIKKELNEEEIIHVIKLLYNDLSEHANLQITNLLRKTGYLLTHCIHCGKVYALEKQWLAHLYYEHGIITMEWDYNLKFWRVEFSE